MKSLQPVGAFSSNGSKLNSAPERLTFVGPMSCFAAVVAAEWPLVVAVVVLTDASSA